MLHGNPSAPGPLGWYRVDESAIAIAEVSHVGLKPTCLCEGYRFAEQRDFYFGGVEFDPGFEDLEFSRSSYLAEARMLLVAAIRLANSLPIDKHEVVNLFVSSSELAIMDNHAPLAF